MRYFALIITLCLISQLSYSQPQNGVKLGYHSFSYGTIAYERALTDNFSLELEYGNLIGSGFLNRRLRTFEVTDDNGTVQTLDNLILEDRTLDVDDFKFRGNHFCLAARFYPGEDAISGFYVGPYLTYTTSGIKKGTATDDLGHTYEGSFLFNSFHIGGELGWNWVLGGSDSGFLIDLTLFGLSAGFYSLETEYTTTDTSIDFAGQVQDVEEWFQTDEAIFADNRDLAAKSNGVKIGTSAVLPVPRFQFSLGYAF